MTKTMMRAVGLLVALATAACGGLPTGPTMPSGLPLAGVPPIVSATAVPQSSTAIEVDIQYAHLNRVPFGQVGQPSLTFEWCAEAAHINATALVISTDPSANFYAGLGDYGPGCHDRRVESVPTTIRHLRIFVDGFAEGNGQGDRDITVEPPPISDGPWVP